MKKYFLIIPLALSLAACETQDQTTLASTAAGAAIGAAVSDNEMQGAAIGGIVGLAAATLLGRSATTPGKCVYRDVNGRQFVADC